MMNAGLGSYPMNDPPTWGRDITRKNSRWHKILRLLVYTYGVPEDERRGRETIQVGTMRAEAACGRRIIMFQSSLRHSEPATERCAACYGADRREAVAEIEGDM